jgi:hypothetical protein
VTDFHSVSTVVLTAALFLWPLGVAAGSDDHRISDVAVKAAMLYNFAKFTSWEGLRQGAPIVACLVGDERIAAAFVETVQGRAIDGHALEVLVPTESAAWGSCNLMFFAAAQAERSSAAIEVLKALPILTVGDGAGFAQIGIIGLYVESERVRFAINLDALERSGLHLSSQLLSLANVVRNRPVR